MMNVRCHDLSGLNAGTEKFDSKTEEHEEKGEQRYCIRQGQRKYERMRFVLNIRSFS